MRRWFVRIFLTLSGLMLLVALAVQIVLASDLPRKWVLSAIEQKLQLRVFAQEFTTTWMGHSRLRGVTLALPLAQESFIQADTIRLKHTTLIGLALGRGLNVNSIEIERPNLVVRQLPDGRWNVQEVAELIRRSGGGKQPETNAPPASGELPRLPRLAVTDGIIRIVDVAGNQATLQPVQVQGRPDGALIWRYEAGINDRISIIGQVAPGRAWPHQLRLSLRQLGTTFSSFLSKSGVSFLDSIQLNGAWEGQFDAKFSGRLDIQRLQIGTCEAKGPVNIQFENGQVVITPAGLVVQPPAEIAPPARANSGTITLGQQSVATRDVSLAFAGGEVRLAGQYNWGAGNARLDASWNRLVYPAGTAHGGSLVFSLTQPWPNQPVIDATLTSTGKINGAGWNARLKLDGQGSSWENIAWQLTVPQLQWQQKDQTWDLSNLAAQAVTRGDDVLLQSLTVPPGKLYGNLTRGDLNAHGQYTLSSGDWRLFLSGTRWPLVSTNPAPASFILNVGGNPRSTWLQEFFFQVGEIQVWATGQLHQSKPGMPVELDVYGWYPPTQSPRRERWVAPVGTLSLEGRLRTELHVSKHAWPTNLAIDGRLFAREVVIGKHPVGDVEMKLAGKADGEHLSVATTELELLSGSWNLTADLRYQPRAANFTIGLRHLSLTQLDNFIAPPPSLHGYASGNWTIRVPDLDPRQMNVEGAWAIDNLARWSPPPPPQTADPIVRGPEGAVQASYIAGPETQPASVARARQPRTQPSQSAALKRAATQPAGKLVPIADRIEGPITIDKGRVRLAPIAMRFRDGRGTASIVFPLEQPKQIQYESTLAAWPVELAWPGSNATILIWSGARLHVNLREFTAQGPVNLTASLWVGDQPVAHVVSKADFVQRQIDLTSLKGDILGGTLGGNGMIDLEKPLRSKGAIRWNNMDAARITQVYPIVEGLVGRFDGGIEFTPAAGDRNVPAGALMITGASFASRGRYKTIDLSTLRFRGYLSPGRAVLEQFKWDLARGTLEGWGRATWDNPSLPFIHLTTNLHALSIEQIVHSIQPADKTRRPLPGKLSGRMMIAGNPMSSQGRRQASGEGFLRIEESDLANATIVNALYNVLSAPGSPTLPMGRGHARFRLEGSRLEVPTVSYFNRGVDLWATGTVEHIFRGKDAAITGTAAGSARPLRDLKLPFAADADRILRALQGGLATVRIGGTVSEPDVKVISFAEAGDAFRRFMIGQVKEEMQTTPGR